MSSGGGGGGGGCSSLRRGAVRMRRLRMLVRSTQRALSNVANILTTESDVSSKVEEIGSLSARRSALVILGSSPGARARLVHCLLGRTLLPDPMPEGIRWIRLQYGSSLQVHMSLGNSEFELLEELHCSDSSWQTLPLEDILRHDSADLTTVLDIEMNNQFLQQGLRILLPPDLADSSPDSTMESLREKHSEFFAKRELILNQYNPIYLYALDRIGRNVFAEHFYDGRSEGGGGDVWGEGGGYYMTGATGGSCGGRGRESGGSGTRERGRGEPCVLSAENCLDLQQSKRLNVNAQVLFVLFSDSRDVSEEPPLSVSGSCSELSFATEATESTERNPFDGRELPESDQNLIKEESVLHCENPNSLPYEESVEFMRELISQWGAMSNPSPITDIEDNWLILDDTKIRQNYDNGPLAPDTHNTRDADNTTSRGDKGGRERERSVRERSVLIGKVMKYAGEALQGYVLDYCRRLSEVHVKLLQHFILASFDLARELQIVPKRIQYVASQERLLYETINEKFTQGEKKRELVRIMREVLEEMKTDVRDMDWSVDDLPYHRDQHYTGSSYDITSSSGSRHQEEVEQAETYDSYNFDDYEIILSTDDDLIQYVRRDGQTNEASCDGSRVGSIPVENESDVFSLDSGILRFGAGLVERGQACCGNTTTVTVKQASLDVQRTVLDRLSRKIGDRLVDFVDCLRDSYFGTLQRCLESLEASCREEASGVRASEAARQVLTVARQVDLQSCASFPVLGALLDSIRRLFHKLRLVSGGEGAAACCVLSPVWRRHVALHTVHGLSARRLAGIIAGQVAGRLREAHDRYQVALGALEGTLAGRLQRTEDVKLAIRKKYAPGFARLCLESTSLCDLLVHGTPDLTREIGRGQYGVVYGCRGSWAGREPCAVKSVLPADDRHYDELAMEFFYARSIPAHPRIVPLYGSLVSLESGSPGVLLVSERKCRDLHSAVRSGLPFDTRIGISLDIVHGIRYLHSLGLIHRDIKMKNVLLDRRDRASLTDLGFCIPEALMSGSVVGTPVHMAPELLAGDYDGTVDVYAFGILFWYVCAGNTNLPAAFEAFQNKEQLWSKVRRGLRPERLPHFTAACWELMESCWHRVPASRALLGDVQRALETMLGEDARHPPPRHSSEEGLGLDSDCSLTQL